MYNFVLHVYPISPWIRPWGFQPRLLFSSSEALFQCSLLWESVLAARFRCLSKSSFLPGTVFSLDKFNKTKILLLTY